MLSSIQHTRQETNFTDNLSAAVEATLTSKPMYSKVSSITTGHLASLVATFAQNIMFEPENEEEPVFLNKLPGELLVMIILTLDTTSIERFARVCKKARILTLDPMIWTYVYFTIPIFMTSETSFVQRTRSCHLSPTTSTGDFGHDTRNQEMHV